VQLWAWIDLDRCTTLKPRAERRGARETMRPCAAVSTARKRAATAEQLEL
jgi:hypothetical protein